MKKLSTTLLILTATLIISCKKEESQKEEEIITDTVTNEVKTGECDDFTFTWNDVTNPVTGKTWMDRNLGAKRVATSPTDELAYGDLYQWGRGKDGHQCRNSDTTSTLSPTDTPGHSDFITSYSYPNDWRSPQNNNLWQEENGINNPCPSGYRLPTDDEWEAEIATWTSDDASGAYGSVLKLPMAGGSSRSDGSLLNVGTLGLYWSSTVSGSNASCLLFNSSNAFMYADYRALGYSVRCLKD